MGVARGPPLEPHHEPEEAALRMTSPQDDAPRPPAWAAPGGGQPSPGPGVPPSGPPAPPGPPAQWGASQSGWGAPVPPPPPPGSAWKPPALQPGIVPLRPLGLGEVLDGAFKAIRANPRVMFGLSALVVGAAVILSTILTWYVQGLVAGAISDALLELDPSGASGLNAMLGWAVGTILTAPIIWLATTVLTGLLIVSVSRSVLGRTITIGEVLRSGRVWWVVGFTLLAGAAVLLVAALLVGAVIGLATADQTGLAVAVGILGWLALVVAGIWFTIRTLLAPPALMLEGKGFWSTVARAWRLTRGSFWRLLGYYVLVQIMVSVASYFVMFPFELVGTLVTQDPTGTSFVSIVLTAVGNVIAYTLTTAFTAAIYALLYIDVRMRREGLDLELARAAQAG